MPLFSRDNWQVSISSTGKCDPWSGSLPVSLELNVFSVAAMRWLRHSLHGWMSERQGARAGVVIRCEISKTQASLHPCKESFSYLNWLRFTVKYG